MKAEYKRNLKDNYLILSAPEEKEEDDYSIYMVEKNQIPGLLLLRRSRVDGKLLLNYEITGKQTLVGLYERKLLRCADILLVLSELCEVLDTLQKYLLSPEKLIFDPEYIYLEPERKKLFLCYAPGVKNEASIQALAEFILRRLDHQDAEAVAAGYRFYGKTQEENFSLQNSLKELMLEYQSREEGKGAGSVKSEYEAENDGYRSRISPPYGIDRQREETVQPYAEAFGRVSSVKRYEEPEVIHKTRRKYQAANGEASKQNDTENMVKQSLERRNSEKNSAVKAEKANKKSEKVRFADRLFEIVHPAVLLSGLFLLAMLEILFYFGYLQLTETGGAFFLILSGELLINSFWKRAKEEKEKQKFDSWAAEEEEDEEYQELMQEMYRRSPEPAESPEEIGETRCLTDLKEQELRLVPVRHQEISGTAEGDFPDIIVKQSSVTVGKMRQQCDIVLMAPAISRMHARLEYRQGAYYLKDLNSRNGTFLNGERLMPQEARSLNHGDRVAFADISYRAIRM